MASIAYLTFLPVELRAIRVGPQVAIPSRVSYLHAALTRTIIGTFFSVYNELGSGFPESVYRCAMAIALAEEGLHPATEVLLPVWFRGRIIKTFRADLVIANGPVLLEVKARSTIDLYEHAQIIGYLRATDIEVGLLLNFGPRATFKRFVYENTRKHRRSSGGSAASEEGR